MPKVTLTAPAFVDWNNNFDEGKTNGSQRQVDWADASPFRAAGQLQLTQHGLVQLTVTPATARKGSERGQSRMALT